MRLIRIAGFIAPSAASVGLFILAFATGGNRLVATVSPDAVWEVVPESSTNAARTPAQGPDSSRVLRLNKEALRQLLARTPMERSGDLRNSPAILSLPMPDGSYQSFRIEESPVMDAKLVARYPEIKS
jgi:hypothetical protein